ncbi:MAG: hypothetical protein AAF755_05805 [Pseudomonadota bacterium]
MRFVILTILAVFYVSPAFAGAWLRDEGGAFVAFSYGINEAEEGEGSFYYEFGLTGKTTLGFDAAYRCEEGLAKSGHGTFFLRRALLNADKSNKLSYELGLGVSREQGQETTHVKTGLAWGRGLAFANRTGWMSVQSSVLWQMGDGSDLYKIESTFGMNISKLMTGIVELNLSHKDGDTSTSFEPSLLFTPRNDTFKIKFGTSSPLDDFNSTALKIGIWQQF